MPVKISFCFGYAALIGPSFILRMVCYIKKEIMEKSVTQFLGK